MWRKSTESRSLYLCVRVWPAGQQSATSVLPLHNCQEHNHVVLPLSLWLYQPLYWLTGELNPDSSCATRLCVCLQVRVCVIKSCHPEPQSSSPLKQPIRWHSDKLPGGQCQSVFVQTEEMGVCLRAEKRIIRNLTIQFAILLDEFY